MKAEKARDNIWYVGVLDKDLKVFDIVMETEFGTSYNSYLVKGKTKTVLFETVKDKFFDEQLERISEVCDPKEIDYIVMNHSEPDHSGSLKKMLEVAKGATVVGSMGAINFLGEILNEDFRKKVVKDGDSIDIGGATLEFIMTPMLHWPDTMFTYIPEYKSLFTCDCFGCHYASEKLFSDKIDGDFYDAYKYYFDGIISPFKIPYMQNALEKIKDLDIEFIGTGHGPVIRDNIEYYINLYKKWSYPEKRKEKEVTVVYVSAYGYTKALAENIVKGLKNQGINNINIFDLVTDNKDAAKAAIAESDGFLLGSPTMVGFGLPPIYEMLVGLNPIVDKGKFAGAFGAYGWSGEAVPSLISRMKELKLNIPSEDGFRVKFKPTEQDLENAVKFGEDFAESVKA